MPQSYKGKLTPQKIGEALFEELLTTPYANNLDAFRDKCEEKTHYRSADLNFWKEIVLRIIQSKNVHRETLKKYRVSCYLAFKRKYKAIKNSFMLKATGKN